MFLRYAGLRPVVVHGGGPQITEHLDRLGIESRVPRRPAGHHARGDGRRPHGADRPGQRARSSDLHQRPRPVRRRPVRRGRAACSPPSGAAPSSTASTVDIGQVGDVVEVDPSAVLALLDAGRIPVIATVARGRDGQTYNVNADTAAAALAVGARRREADRAHRRRGPLRRLAATAREIVSEIGTDELAQLLPSLSSGMVPKMEACLRAVEGGVPRAHVLDGRVAHALLLEIFTSEGIGTMVVPADRGGEPHDAPQSRWHAVMMDNYGTPPIALDRGDGRAASGTPTATRYLDLVAGIAVSALGHAHPAIVEAVTEQVGRLAHTSNLSCTSRASRWPSGSSSCSALPARGVLRQHRRRGQRGGAQARPQARPHRRARSSSRATSSFHGRTMGALSLTGNAGQARAVRAAARTGHASSTTATSTPCAPPSTTRTAAVIRRADPGRGRRRPAAGRLPRRGARGLRRRRRAADRRRGAERHRPHRPLVRQPGRGRAPGRHHAGQGPRRRPADRRLPRHRRRGRAVRARRPRQHLRRQPGLVRGGARRARHHRGRRPARQREDASASTWRTVSRRLGSPLVAGVRGTGLWRGVALTGPHAPAVEAAARAHGLLVNAVRPDTLRLAPPLILTAAEVDEALPLLGAALGEVAPMTLRHFLRDDDLAPDELLDGPRPRRRDEGRPPPLRPLAGPRAVALIFDKQTLRTQLSFSVGVAELGGQPIVVDGRLAGIGERESIADTTRVLTRQVAAIVWRTYGQDRLEEMAAHSTRPGRQRAHRLLPPVPGPRRPADRARAPRNARRADAHLRRRRRQQHGALLPARRGRRRAARPHRLPGRLRARPGSSPTPHAASPRAPAVRSPSPTTRARRSTARTSSPPTRGCRWGRRTSGTPARRRSAPTP